MNENSQEISTRKIIKDFFVKIFKDGAEGNTLFHKAAQTGNIPLLGACIDWELDPNKCNNLGESPLDNAIQKGHRLIIRTLVEFGATVDTKAITLAKDDDIKKYLEDHTQELALTPLEKEWDCDNEEAQKIREKRLADFMINTKDENGNTVFHVLAERGYVDPLIDFSKVRAINIKNNLGETPLHVLMKNGSLKTVKKFIKTGVRPDGDALELAQNLDMYRLLKRGQDDYDKKAANKAADADDSPLLHQDIEQLSFEFLKEIITKEYIDEKTKYNQLKDALTKTVSDINAIDEYGHSILYFAVEKGYSTIVTLLIENGADVDGSNLEITPLQHALDLIKWHENPCVAKALLEKGADINGRSACGWTPCHYAVKVLRNESALKFLLENGADINKKTIQHGFTPLHMASDNNDLNLIKILVNNGAKLNEKNNEGNTALHYSHDPRATDFLIKSGADINLKNNKGETPLHFAIEHNYTSSAEKLIENGADINAKTLAGITITKLVQKKKSWGLVIPLIKHGATFENWNFSSTPKNFGALIKTVRNFHLLAQQKLSLETFITEYFDDNQGDILGYLLPYGNKKTTQAVRKWCDERNKFMPHYKVIYANKSLSTTSQKTPFLAYGKLYKQKVKNGF